jgi:hypothetical protein
MLFLFQFLLFFILFIFLLGFVSLIFLRYKVRKLFKKGAPNSASNQQHKDGDVWIKDSANSNEGTGKYQNLGEYVDYEEVKE